MNEQEERERYRYLQLKAKAAAPASEDSTEDTAVDNRRFDQKLASGITSVMHAIDQPGTVLGIEQPEVNRMAPQGDVMFNKAGEAVTDFMGRQTQIPGVSNPYVAAAAGTAVSLANPQNWLTPAMPGRTPLPGQQMFQEAARDAGRKSLGYTKAYLNKAPGNLEKANEVAQTMLDEGVITNPIRHPFSSGSQSMLERAQDVGQLSGRAMEESVSQLAQAGKKSFSTSDVISEIETQLNPKYQGGAYASEQNIVNEIIDTVKAHGEGPLDFNSAQALKEKLQELGKFDVATGAAKSKLYRRASGIVRDALDRAVVSAGQERTLPVMEVGSKTGEAHALFAYNDKFGPGGTERSVYNVYGDPTNPLVQKVGYGSSITKADLDKAGIPVTGREPGAAKYNPLDEVGQVDKGLHQLAASYIYNKNLFGKTKQAEKALTNRVSSEQGNKNIGLTDTIIAGAELAGGNPARALVTIGAKKAFERGYHATKASVADWLSKSAFASPIQKRVLGGTALGTTAAASSNNQDVHNEFIRRYVKRTQ